MDKISVLMGVYNCEMTLPAAIDSIICQTYTHWELIICDDGSTDSTYKVALEYAKRFPEKIMLLKNDKNVGLNYTLNRCLNVASGKYVARMDGDDLSLPSRFQKEVTFLKEHPDISVVSTPMIYFDDKGTWAIGRVCEFPDKRMLVSGTVHCHAPCMIRIEAIRKVGGYSESKRLLRVEDWHLWIKIYSAGMHGANLQEPLYMMRDDQNAAKRRKYRYRLNEAYVSTLAVKKLGLPLWRHIYAFRPLLVGLLPKPIYIYLHRKKQTQKA